MAKVSITGNRFARIASQDLAKRRLRRILAVIHLPGTGTITGEGRDGTVGIAGRWN